MRLVSSLTTGDQPLQPGNDLTGKTALVTGGATRIGAATVRLLHAAGANVAIHYRSSAAAAEALCGELEAARTGSCLPVQADLLDPASWAHVVAEARQLGGRLDVLINNASTYYPTPVDEATQDQWDDLFGTNAQAPFFIARAAAPELRRNRGCIVNLVDIHAERPNADHPIYCMAKAANAMMVKALARDLAPDVRVNGIAPGTALWPAGHMEDAAKQEVLERIPLGRPAGAGQIAEAVMFMVTGPDYVTGQILAVDGGRSVQQ
jgi:pteridine reductase